MHSSLVCVWCLQFIPWTVIIPWLYDIFNVCVPHAGGNYNRSLGPLGLPGRPGFSPEKLALRAAGQAWYKAHRPGLKISGPARPGPFRTLSITVYLPLRLLCSISATVSGTVYQPLCLLYCISTAVSAAVYPPFCIYHCVCCVVFLPLFCCNSDAREAWLILSKRATRPIYMKVQVRLNAISPYQSQQSSPARQDISVSGHTRHLRLWPYETSPSPAIQDTSVSGHTRLISGWDQYMQYSPSCYTP